MQISTGKHSKPQFRRLRLASMQPKAAAQKTPTRAQRFIAAPPFDLKFVGDHLKNYFTVGGLCLLAVWLGQKGGNYDRSAPLLGATMAYLIAIIAMVYGCLNVAQMMESIRKPGKKGWLWRLGYGGSMVFLCFFLTAVIQHGLDTTSSIGSHAIAPSR